DQQTGGTAVVMGLDGEDILAEAKGFAHVETIDLLPAVAAPDVGAVEPDGEGVVGSDLQLRGREPRRVAVDGEATPEEEGRDGRVAERVALVEPDPLDAAQLLRANRIAARVPPESHGANGEQGQGEEPTASHGESPAGVSGGMFGSLSRADRARASKR